ncbi:MAG: glycosyltransferase family 61 protein [Chroococcidiopsidaceae cyanobacterium CP_BM_RX_35]|nr:glycosyltransferase family 61 protein [Chroococcidiopsidaceae cyanobacterium CP_BM_RX_35]
MSQLHQEVKKLVRRCVNALDWVPIVRSLKITQFVYAKDAIGKYVENYRILVPPEVIELTSEADKEFLKICDISCDFKGGYFNRSEIFVCDVVPAYVNVGGGIVCTKDFKFLVEPGMDYRLEAYGRIGWSKPFYRFRVRKISGLCSSLLTIGWSKNYWHWLYEDLPKIYSLILAVPSQKLTMLLPEDLSVVQKEFLKCLLPETFEVMYVPHGTWLKTDRFVMPSFASRRRNGLLPPQYYEFIRNAVFKKLGLNPVTELVERIYISRAKAKHRRVINEDQVTEYLARFGFKTVFLEEMSFKEQIDLFRRAEIVVGAHGAGLATTLFSGRIKVLVLYPNSQPITFFFTQTKGLGQEHYFLAHDLPNLDDDFEVNMPQFEYFLIEKLELGAKGLSKNKL